MFKIEVNKKAILAVIGIVAKIDLDDRQLHTRGVLGIPKLKDYLRVFFPSETSEPELVKSTILNRLFPGGDLLVPAFFENQKQGFLHIVSKWLLKFTEIAQKKQSRAKLIAWNSLWFNGYRASEYILDCE